MGAAEAAAQAPAKALRIRVDGCIARVCPVGPCTSSHDQMVVGLDSLGQRRSF